MKGKLKAIGREIVKAVTTITADLVLSVLLLGAGATLLVLGYRFLISAERWAAVLFTMGVCVVLALLMAKIFDE